MTDNKKTPVWVTEQQFVKILKKQCDDFKSVKNFKITPAVTDGENYITRILRIEIESELRDGAINKTNFILKIPLQCDDNGEEKDSYHEMFLSEQDMYENVVPELEKMYAEVAGVQIKFGPKCFRFDNEPKNDYILMEDLQPRGFKNENRLVGLNEMQAKQVLEKLSKWHAASAKRVEMYGDYSEEYRKSYLCEEHREIIEGMNEVFTKPFLECMETYKIEKDLKQMIQDYSKQLNKLYIKFGTVNSEDFNVLNHGDFWINNFMFQYNQTTAEMKDIYFVDFQFPKYGNSAQDLLCFLMTSTQMEIKLKKFDEFVEFYFECLTVNLRLLKYTKPFPTLLNLRKTLRNNGVWAFVCAQRMLAVSLLEPQKNSNIETFMSTDEEGIAFKKQMFSNPKYVQQMENIIPWLINGGYLN